MELTVAKFSRRRGERAALVHYHLLTGGALLIASVLAGWLWQAYWPAATFGAGAAFEAVAATIMAVRMLAVSRQPVLLLSAIAARRTSVDRTH
jgi:hypothetical protein